MLNYLSSEETSPDIQSELPFTQVEVISPCPIIGSLGKEAASHLAKPSFQAVVERSKVSSEPTFPQAKQPHSLSHL